MRPKTEEVRLDADTGRSPGISWRRRTVSSGTCSPKTVERRDHVVGVRGALSFDVRTGSGCYQASLDFG
jgi:hypothetical protein